GTDVTPRAEHRARSDSRAGIDPAPFTDRRARINMRGIRNAAVAERSRVKRGGNFGISGVRFRHFQENDLPSPRLDIRTDDARSGPAFMEVGRITLVIQKTEVLGPSRRQRRHVVN
ncbi:MAG: hypothetical protein WD407_03575, partial [Rhodospirillales bacterium]